MRYGASMAWTLKVDAEDRAKKEKAVEIAKNLLKIGINIEIIIKSTGLTKEEIETLKNK